MFIETEQTPNPNVLKFLPGENVLEKGTAEFKDKDAALAASPFAARLFDIKGVINIFLAKDYVSVSKEDTVDWVAIKPLILAVVMDHIGSGLPVLNDNAPSQTIPDEDLDEISVQIIELIEERIRPAVAQDGGDIEFSRFEDGIVYVNLRGACSGCPSATITLKAGIENMLKHFIPEVVEVRENML